MITIPLIVAGALYLTLAVARNGGCGALGRKIRNSDHWALMDAIAEKEQELAELRKLIPKYPLQ